MGVKLVQLAKGKIIGTGDIHLEELVPVDTNVPTTYVKKWPCGKTQDDKVTAYLTGTSGNYSLHIYGSGEMQNYTGYNDAPWSSYRVKHFIAHTGITAIGNYCMAGDTNGGNLRDIVLANTVRVIGIAAFNTKNTNITSIELPNGVRHIRNTAFAELSGVNSISIPDSVRRIDNNAFKNVPWFTSQTDATVVAGNGVLLKMNSQAANRVIPDGVKFISGLGSNSLITSLTFPYGLKGIGRFACDGMVNLTSLVLPDTITWLGTACLRGFCGETINIPLSLKRIPSRMLLNCSAFSHIYIPHTIAEIWTWEHGDNTAESGAFANGAPFFGCSGNLHIYCESEQKPTGWDEYWDYISSSQRATVHWGVSRTAYETSIGGE